MEKSQKVLLLSTIILVGFALGVIYHYCLGFYLKAGEPFNSFVYPASMAFCDFTGSIPYIQDFAPYQNVTLWVVYFPLTYLLFFPFVLIKPWIISYLIFASIFLSFLTFANIKFFYCQNLTKLINFQNLFILSLISYPVLYNLDKGNFDMFLFIIVSCFVFSFKSQKYLLSSFLLAVANAIKPFTALCLLLFLLKKKYKEFFLSIILSALMIIGGFMIFKGAFFYQIIMLIKSIALFKTTYALTPVVKIGFSSSLFMPLKALMLLFATKTSDLSIFVKYYGYLCYILTAITLFFVCWEKSLWKQLTLLFCNFLLLPYVTYDYKFIFLFIPIWLFVNEEKKSKFDLIYTILFALLFVPKSVIVPFYTFNNQIQNWISLSAIINPIIMILLTLLIIHEQFITKKGRL